MDVLTRNQRRKNMQHIRAQNTTPEIVLRKALWRKGIRYRKNYNQLPGTPDIVLTHQRIAIFVDGDFWHAKGYENNPGEQVGTNKDFWVKKLSRNVERDKEVNDVLTEQGWLVLRFWESDVLNNLDACVNQVLSYI